MRGLLLRQESYDHVGKIFCIFGIGSDFCNVAEFGQRFPNFNHTLDVEIKRVTSAAHSFIDRLAPGDAARKIRK